MSFKGLALCLLLGGPAPTLYAGDVPGELHVYSFGGVNNSVDPYIIADTDAQAAANVITDEGDLRSMPGSRERYDLGKSTVSFLGSFIDESSRKVIMAQSGAEVLASTTSGTFATIQTLTAVRDIDGVQAFKRFYMTDRVSRPFYYSGASTAAAAGMDPCYYVEFYATRLVCVGISTDTSRVSLSAYNLPENWTVTTTADSAVVKYFHRDDGEPVTCVKTTPYGLFIGKPGKTGLLKGSDAENFYWYPLSDDIGCVDDRTVQMVDGAVVWLSRRGWAGFAGSGTTEIISKEIKSTTDDILATNSSEQTWSVASKASWQLGTGAGWDYDITAGSIKARTYNGGTLTDGTTGHLMMFANSGFEYCTSGGWSPAFTYVDGGNVRRGSCSGWGFGAAAGATLGVYDAATDALIDSATWPAAACSEDCGWSGRLGFQMREFSGIAGSGDVYLKLTDSNGTVHTGGDFDRAAGARVYRDCCTVFGTVKEYFDTEESSSPVITAVSAVKDSGLTAPDYAVNLKGQQVAMRFYYSADSSSWASEDVGIGGSLSAAAKKRYWKYSIVFSSGVALSSFTSVAVTAFSTSTYTSPVYSVGSDIAAWGNFAMGYTESEVGLSSFQVRSATYTFADDADAPAWTTQTNNTNVNVSTGSSLQYRILPNIATSTQTTTFASSVASWTNGTLAPRPASLSYDGRYLCCVSTDSLTVNDQCWLWQRNKKWVPMVGPSYASLMVHNNTPMAGDGTSGSKIYDIMQDGVYKYGSEAMNSYWITKDYTFGALNNHKVIDRLWLISNDSASADFGVAWMADRDEVWNSTTTSLSNTVFVNKEVDGLFESAYPGRQFRLKFSSSELEQYFRLKDFSVYYRVNDLIK